MSTPEQEKVLSNIFTEFSQKLTDKYYQDVVSSNAINLEQNETSVKKDINVDIDGIISALSNLDIINQITDYISSSLQFKPKNTDAMKELVTGQFTGEAIKECLSKLTENIDVDNLETDSDVSNAVANYIKTCIVRDNLEGKIYRLSENFTYKNWFSQNWKMILFVFIILLVIASISYYYFFAKKNKKNTTFNLRNFIV